MKAHTNATTGSDPNSREKAGWAAVSGWLGDVGGWIDDHKGPEEHDKKLLIPAGKWIMGSLEKGLKSQLSSLKSTLEGITSTVAGTEFEPLEATIGAKQERITAAQSTSASLAKTEREQFAEMFDKFLTQFVDAARSGTRQGVTEGFGSGSSDVARFARMGA